jgi:AMP-activated protein kinase-like protein
MTSTPGDRRPQPDDPTLRRVVAELRRPVAFDQGIDAGALRVIAAGGRRAAGDRPRRWLGLAGAGALAASIAIAFGVYRTAPAGSGSRPVLLRLVAPASSAVAVVGDFNDWNPAANPLEPTGAGEWIVRLELRPGRYRYTFLVDGREWKSDPAEPPAPDDDYGAPLSVLTVI